MDISIARDGQVIDQVTLAEAAVRLKEGTLLETDFYWRPGMPAWRPLPHLFAAKVSLPFTRPVPAAPTFLDRMLRRLSETECLARYWDLLAISPDHGAVPVADLDALDVTCGCSVRRRCGKTLRSWFAAYVAMVLADGAVADAERTMLTRVASAFGISADHAASELKGAVLRHYGAQMPLLLRSDQSIDGIVAAVRKLEASLGVPASEVAEARAVHLETFFSYLIGDEPTATVSPLLARSIRAKATAFDFDLTSRGNLGERLARAEANWEAENGPLPVVDVDIILGRDEVCHWTANCGLSQMKRVTVGLSYGGPVATIRIMRGLSWRMASYRGARETEIQLVDLDQGTVYFTNKRIVFNGGLKNLVIKLERIIDLNGYKDAIHVEQATGVSPFFMLTCNPVIPHRILTRLCKDAQG